MKLSVLNKENHLVNVSTTSLTPRFSFMCSFLLSSVAEISTSCFLSPTPIILDLLFGTLRLLTEWLLPCEGSTTRGSFQRWRLPTSPQPRVPYRSSIFNLGPLRPYCNFLHCSFVFLLLKNKEEKMKIRGRLRKWNIFDRPLVVRLLFISNDTRIGGSVSSCLFLSKL